MKGRIDAGEVERRLAGPYRAVLAGIAAGEPDEALAERAGVDVAAVPALVRLASAKLLDLGVELPERADDAGQAADDARPTP